MPIRVLKDQKKKCTQEIKKTRHVSIFENLFYIYELHLPISIFSAMKYLRADDYIDKLMFNIES